MSFKYVNFTNYAEPEDSSYMKWYHLRRREIFLLLPLTRTM